MKKILISAGIVFLLTAVFVFVSLFLGKYGIRFNQFETKIGEINLPTAPRAWLGCIGLMGASVHFGGFFPDSGLPYKFAYTTTDFPTTENPNCVYKEFINPFSLVLDLGIFIVLVLFVRRTFKRNR